MSLQTDTKDIERALGAAGVSIDTMLHRAGVNRSTWTRWKSATVTGARYDVIERVKAAAAEVISEAAERREAQRGQDAAA